MPPKYASGLTQPSPFEYQTHGSNARRWATWVRSFNIYLKAAGVTVEDAELNTFLYVVG
jgi:hypothetical protein